MRVSAATRQQSMVRDPSDRALSVGVASASRPRNLIVLFAAAALAGAVGAAGLSAAAVAMVGMALLGFGLLVARDSIDFELARRGLSLRPEVNPTELAPRVGRLYAELLAAHERVRRALERSSRPVETAREVHRQCGEMIHAAGRAARTSSRLERYLEANSREWIEAEAERLERRAASGSDPTAGRAFERAAAARRRQLETHVQIEGLHARVESRIAMLTSFLASVEALIIRREAVTLASDPRTRAGRRRPGR